MMAMDQTPAMSEFFLTTVAPGFSWDQILMEKQPMIILVEKFLSVVAEIE